MSGEPGLVVDHVLLGGLKLMGGNLDQLGANLLRALHHGGSAESGAPAPEGAHAEGHATGIPVYDLDIIEVDAELVRHQLSEGRLVALTVGV